MKRIIPLLIGLTFVFRCAYASGVEKDLYSDSDKHYKISGTTETGFEPVKIEILKSGYTFDDVSNVTSDNIGDVYLYVDQIYSAENKAFSFDIPIESAKGNFYVKVSYWNGNSEQKSFCNFNDEDVKNAIAEFANSENKDASAADLFIRTYYSAIDVDLEDYTKSLTSDGRNELCAAMANKITADMSIDSLKTEINGYMAYLLINEYPNSYVLTKYEKYVLLSESNYYEDWKNFDADTKQKIAEKVSGAKSPEDVKKSIENAVILTALDATVWSGQRNKLEHYKKNLSLDLTAADSLDAEYQKNLYVEFKDMISSAQVTDISQISTEIEKLAEKHRPPEKLLNGGGGGSKGGSGKGGGTSFVSPVTEEKTAKEPTLPFEDIKDTEWASVPIVKLYQKGIVNGKTDKLFEPNGYVTREEFTALIVRAFAIETDETCDFDDVDKNRWSASAISAAQKNGIIGGTGNNMFLPESKITRQDMAVIAHRAGKYAGFEFDENTASSFGDGENIADYATKAVSELYKAKIVNGKDNGFCPLDYTTRAEAAVIIYRLMQSCKLAI